MSIEIKEMTDADFEQLQLDSALMWLFQRHAETVTYDEFCKQYPKEVAVGLWEQHYIDDWKEFSGESVIQISALGMKVALDATAKYNLDAFAYRVAIILSTLDLPISSLIAAAMMKADLYNDGILGGCYPTIKSNLAEHYNGFQIQEESIRRAALQKFMRLKNSLEAERNLQMAEDMDRIMKEKKD